VGDADEVPMKRSIPPPSSDVLVVGSMKCSMVMMMKGHQQFVGPILICETL
jgi:hypothetical protein